jgi:hypothetical protein
MKVKILVVTLMIALMPMALTSITYNGNVKEQYLYFLQAGQFDELSDLVKTMDPKDIPEVGLNQFFMGSRLAGFLAYSGYDSVAYETFQKLIGMAVSKNQLDSAQMVAESFAKTYPKFDLPVKILKTLAIARKGNQEKNS